MPTLNATVYPDEAYVLVEVDWLGTILQDRFSRVVTDAWGTPDVGPIWNDLGGVPANRSVNGTKGILTHTAVNTQLREISNVNVLNIDMEGEVVNTVVPTGGNFELEFIARWVDSNNFVGARLFCVAGNGVTCQIRQVVGGVETGSAFPVIPSLLTADSFSWRFLVNGSQLLFRAWRTGTPEPLSWNVSFTTTWLTAGGAGVRSSVAAGVTNPVPISFQFDNFVFSDPAGVNPLYGTVTRRNTVTGEIVTLRPYIAYDSEGNLLLECGVGLWWDTEPPLNVPLEYCAVAAPMDVNLAQNCCFESGLSAPWTAFSGAAIAVSTLFAREGIRSLQMTPNGTGINPGFQQILVTLPDGGVETTISGWIMSPQGWNSVRIEAQVTYTDGITETFRGPTEILDDGEWRFLSHTFTPRTDVTLTVLRFITGGTPPGTTLFYGDQFQLTQKQAVAATACETVTVSSESVWLKNPFTPCSDVEVGLCNPILADCDEPSRVSYVGHESDDYAPNTALWQPVNQRHPIPINRIRRDATSLVRLLAHDCEARDALLLTNEPGDVLLFQAPATYCIPDRYISVGVVSETRISVDQREDFRLVSMPYVVVSRPNGPANGICGARIDDLCDIYTSWAAMTIANLTWTDLLLGLASPNGPGQPDPPAATRTWDDVEAEFADWDAVEAGGTRDWDELRDGL